MRLQQYYRKYIWKSHWSQRKLYYERVENESRKSLCSNNNEIQCKQKNQRAFFMIFPNLNERLDNAWTNTLQTQMWIVGAFLFFILYFFFSWICRRCR